MLKRTFPSPEALRRLPFGLADVAVIFGTLVLLELLEAADLLDFAEVTQGDIRLTEISRDFATTTILRSKDLFWQQVLEHVPMLVSMVQTLRQKRSGAMRADFFLDLIRRAFSA